jgi:hypothetical protein
MFLLTQQQRELLINTLAEFPAKHVHGAINLLLALPPAPAVTEPTETK